jgi:hypothetical protein
MNMTMAFKLNAGVAASTWKRAAAAPVISSELLTGMMFAGALVVIAILAILASSPFDVDVRSWIGLTGP